MEMMRRRKLAGMFVDDEKQNDHGGENNRYNEYDPYRVDVGDRPNNIPMRGDPSSSLQKIKHQPGVDTFDIDLMQKHLDKMDPSTSLDYI